MNLIDRMQVHRDAGGGLFDCPSFSAAPEEKAALYRATNALFNETFKDLPPMADIFNELNEDE
jgi:hypothetical protein